jgi:hypothetical protein
MLDELAVADVLDLVHHPPALAPDPPAADVEDLDGGLELILGQAMTSQSVPSGKTTACFSSARSRAWMSSRSRAARSNSSAAGRGPHLGLQPAGEPGGLAGHEVAELLRQPAVVGLADPLHTGRRALADVAEQAWPADLAGALEHPGRAGPHGENPQQCVDGLPDGPGVGVRAEVAGPAPPAPRITMTRGTPRPW